MILVFCLYLSFTSFILPPAFCWAGLIANDFFRLPFTARICLVIVFYYLILR